MKWWHVTKGVGLAGLGDWVIAQTWYDARERGAIMLGCPAGNVNVVEHGTVR